MQYLRTKITLLTILLFSTIFAMPAFSQLTAPQWMPNFPMIAGDNVMIMWVPVQDAVKYKIYVNGKSLGETLAPPYKTPAPKEAGLYKYTITAVDASGTQGALSKEGKIEIIKLTQPTGFQTQFLGDILNLRWEPVKNAKVYDIYKSENKNDTPEKYKLLASTKNIRYIDTAVKQSEHEVTQSSGKPRKKLYYIIVAKDAFGKKSPMERIETVKVPYKRSHMMSLRTSSITPHSAPSASYYAPPPAHGGTTSPNAAAADAMFFKNHGVNPFVDSEDDHLSTFAVDVDTASYTVARSYLQRGNPPPNAAVRTEEFINYFDYGYASPTKETFGINIEGAPSKFGKNCNLLRIGLKGYDIAPKDRKDAVLTFVVDVSGSMGGENRIGLVKKSLRLLVDQLNENDKIGIVIYGSRGDILMEHKGLKEKTDILLAIDSLRPQGSTFAEEGIRKGYELASKAYRKGAINRVILCTDGVANVGRTGADGILEVIKQYKEKGITLSALGFGMGNYNDILMERLGDKGDGHYAYVDTIAEAKKVFVQNLTGTLQVIAKDVKIQVDFNPETVRSYRLLGYENRDVADNKFRDDKEDGGEVGAGHSVTALYEVKFWPKKNGKLGTVYIRYKDSKHGEVEEVNRDITKADFKAEFSDASTNFRLAAVVAEFAEILKESYWAKGSKLKDVLSLAQEVLNEKKDDADLIELVDLISKAKSHEKKVENK